MQVRKLYTTVPQTGDAASSASSGGVISPSQIKHRMRPAPRREDFRAGHQPAAANHREAARPELQTMNGSVSAVWQQAGLAFADPQQAARRLSALRRARSAGRVARVSTRRGG